MDARNNQASRAEYMSVHSTDFSVEAGAVAAGYQGRSVEMPIPVHRCVQ